MASLMLLRNTHSAAGDSEGPVCMAWSQLRERDASLVSPHRRENLRLRRQLQELRAENAQLREELRALKPEPEKTGAVPPSGCRFQVDSGKMLNDNGPRVGIKRVSLE